MTKSRSQADRIIAAFGGVRPTARAVGCPLSTVTRWRVMGHVGLKWRDRVLRASARLNKGLTADAFLAPATVKALGGPWACATCGGLSPAGAISCVECDEPKAGRKAA